MTREAASLQWPDSSADLIDADDWVSYKFRAADWYIDALRSFHADNGVNRLFGIEMALDGAFSQLNGAFDAAVFDLITAAEAAYPTVLQQSADHRRDIRRLKDKTFPQLTGAGFVSPDPALPNDLELALQSKAPQLGWLEEFRRARNRTTHKTTLPRHFDAVIVDGFGGEGNGALATSAASKIDVGQPVDAVPFLELTRNQIKQLTDQLRRVQRALPA